MNPQKNYIDERGNYHNVENLTLTQIHDRASEEGYRLGKAAAQQKNTDGDTISRSALIVELTQQIAYFADKANTTSLKKDTYAYNHCKEGLILAKKIIENAPTVEPTPEGEWITVKFAREDLNDPRKSKFDFVKCPFCETIHQGRRHFCSYCGARMKEGQVYE